MDTPAISEYEIGLLVLEESSWRYSFWFLDMRNTSFKINIFRIFLGCLFLLFVFLYASCMPSKRVAEVGNDLDKQYGSITGAWEDKDRRNSLLAIVGSDLLLEIDFSGEPDQAVIVETKLKKTGKNSYTPAEKWEDLESWIGRWNMLDANDQDEYGNWETFRREHSFYYIIMGDGNLVHGEYTSIQYRQEMTSTYYKVRLD